MKEVFSAKKPRYISSGKSSSRSWPYRQGHRSHQSSDSKCPSPQEELFPFFPDGMDTHMKVTVQGRTAEGLFRSLAC